MVHSILEKFSFDYWSMKCYYWYEFQKDTIGRKFGDKKFFLREMISKNAVSG